MSDIGSTSPETANPQSSAQKKIMIGTVIVLSLLIVLALGALIAKIVTLASGDQNKATVTAVATPPKPVSMHLAAGYRILSTDTQPGRLILHIRSDTQDEIDIIDTNDGRIVSQIHADAPQ